MKQPNTLPINIESCKKDSRNFPLNHQLIQYIVNVKSFYSFSSIQIGLFSKKLLTFFCSFPIGRQERRI